MITKRGVYHLLSDGAIHLFSPKAMPARNNNNNDTPCLHDTPTLLHTTHHTPHTT